MFLENRFALTYSVRIASSESSSAGTLLIHTDWMMLKNASNQGGANSMTVAPWHTKSRPLMLVAQSKAAFLKNYLAVSTWILNGSSIECHEKKHQPVSLSGSRFGSQAIQISGWKSAWLWSGRKWAFHLWLLITCRTCSKSQCKTHQIAQNHHFERPKLCKEQTV